MESVVCFWNGVFVNFCEFLLARTGRGTAQVPSQTGNCSGFGYFSASGHENLSSDYTALAAG